MADVVTLTTAQHTGTYSFTGEDGSAATGNFSLGENNVIESITGDVTGLGSFTGVLTGDVNPALAFTLEPDDIADAGDLADVAAAIVAAFDAELNPSEADANDGGADS